MEGANPRNCAEVGNFLIFNRLAVLWLSDLSGFTSHLVVLAQRTGVFQPLHPGNLTRKTAQS
jgi:hypothetical protein